MKEPHNHRKVGYSMIVISVSLTLIGLLVWAIGENYHYSTDLMAGQEINAMTPKNGFNVVSFDDSQPVGAKLKLLDHAETNATALQLKEKHTSPGILLLIFGSSLDYNKKIMDNARIESENAAKEMASNAVPPSNTPQTPPAEKTASSVPSQNSNGTHGNETVIITEKINATSGISSSTGN